MDVLGNYIGGRFALPSSVDEELAPLNPADLSEAPTRFPASVAAVDEAVAAARSVRRLWADTPVEHRVGAVQRIRVELQRREQALTAAISQEIGKPLWEAATEVKSMVAKVDVTVNEGMKLIGGFSPQGLSGECRFRPHGVMAVIGPFNFPGHLPNGHIIPALAAGNTIVFKPSEVAPAVGQLYAEAVHAAQLPSGVFNMVQGGRAVGERLTTLEGVDGILFTGSHAVGSHIQRANADNPGKILALELGGKNCSLVLEDAQFDKAIYDVLFSAYVTAGQRCSATSRAIVHRSLVDRFVERMAALVGRLRIGSPKAADTFMGPLATAAGLEKFLLGCQRAKEEGAEVILEPARLEIEPRGHFARPGLHRVRQVQKESAYQREELFGPDLAVYTAEDVDHAIELANGVDYGLTAAVFTTDPSKFERAAERIDAGVINWNAPTVGSSSRLPFGGLKRSGNHRPAGLFSTLYCAYPVAITRGEPSLDRRSIAPGILWD